MKGRNHFTLQEADAIKRVLAEVRRSPRDKQKRLRDTLRGEMGFYITDFTSSSAGFNDQDFDRLVREGSIKVSE